MSGPLAGVSGVLPVETVRLAEVSTGTSANFEARNTISDTVDLAVKTALQMPSSSASKKIPTNTVMPDDADNSTVRDRNLNPEDGQAAAMDAITDKFVELYQEMTIFKVSWQIAKRSGKDIETLLRAQ